VTRSSTPVVNTTQAIGDDESRETFDERLVDELTTLLVRRLVDPTQ
jgi:hypothetical protein